MKHDPIATRHARYVAGAEKYAAADRSDPFAFARAMAHIANGIVGPLRDGSDAMYEAEQALEERTLPDGSTYNAVVYRNMRRP